MEHLGFYLLGDIDIRVPTNGQFLYQYYKVSSFIQKYAVGWGVAQW